MPEVADELLAQAEAALEQGRLTDAAAGAEAALGDAALLADPRRAHRALLCLGRAYGRAGRFFEALVAGRRLVQHARAAGGGRDLATALALLAVALLNARQVRACAEALDELERLLADTPAAEAPDLHRVLHHARANLALEGGDVPEAERRYARLREMLKRGELPPEQAWLLQNGEFHLALARRDLGDMERLLAAVLAGEDGANVYVPEVTLRCGLAQAYVEAGRLDDARRHALAAAQYLEAASAPSEILVDDGAAVARLLHDRLDEPQAALAVADRVSAALLARLAGVEQSAATLGVLAEEGGADLLADVRADFSSALLGFLVNLRTMFGEALSARSVAPAGLLLLCAWCGRSSLTPGRWMELGQFTAGLASRRVTHGMCADCHRQVLPG